ncbi:hypothetical protein J6590_100788 [Homalodisca vitripennis]|nr:hypothetical protein J6590_100788 [Homalodisca vitripennis]
MEGYYATGRAVIRSTAPDIGSDFVIAKNLKYLEADKCLKISFYFKTEESFTWSSFKLMKPQSFTPKVCIFLFHPTGNHGYNMVLMFHPFLAL